MSCLNDSRVSVKVDPVICVGHVTSNLKEPVIWATVDEYSDEATVYATV